MYPIVVKNVTKTFRIYRDKSHSLKETILSKSLDINRYEEFYALKDVSFIVKKGSTVALVGENGCGKSTMLKIIAGILEPNKGSVNVQGRISALLELGAGFHPDYTGRENIYLNGSILGLRRKEIDKRLDDIVDFAELHKFIDTPVRNYSSGMYMRLGFSIAVNVNPDILLVDEVLAVGDEAFQQKCFNKIIEFKESGKTILFVSHSADDVIKLCDEVVLLEHGKVVEIGVPKKVINTYRMRLYDKYVKEESAMQNDDLASEKSSDKLSAEDKESLDYTIQEKLKGAEITNFQIKRSNNIITQLRNYEKSICFEMTVKFNEDIEDPIFGFVLKKEMDGKIVDVYDTNTKWQKTETGIFKKGQIVNIKFIHDMNISRGIYFVDCAVAYKDAKRFYDWKDKITSFYVDDEDDTWRGICNLKSRIQIY